MGISKGLCSRLIRRKPCAELEAGRIATDERRLAES